MKTATKLDFVFASVSNVCNSSIKAGEPGGACWSSGRHPTQVQPGLTTVFLSPRQLLLPWKTLLLDHNIYSGF